MLFNVAQDRRPTVGRADRQIYRSSGHLSQEHCSGKAVADLGIPKTASFRPEPGQTDSTTRILASLVLLAFWAHSQSAFNVCYQERVPIVRHSNGITLYLRSMREVCDSTVSSL